MNEIGLTYDDILLIPKYSDIESRHHVDLSTKGIKVGKDKFTLHVPLIGAPMDTVCGSTMCITLWFSGAIGVLHRYNSVDQQLDEYKEVKNGLADCVVAIGATGDYFERATKLFEMGCRAFCIDVAHGNHIYVQKAIEALRTEYGDEIHIMAGNVADDLGAYNCYKWGADSIRVGVGGGSVCSTRIVTGHGVPNLSAIDAAVFAKTKFLTENPEAQVYIIADGGIRNSGDAAKALAFGADFVMVGSLLAGTEDTPPVEKMRMQGFKGKPETVSYRGMASKNAQEDWRGKASVVEGVAAEIPYKGLTENVVEEFVNGLKSALSYSGARDLTVFRETATFIQISPASQIENYPHIKL